MSTLIEEAVAAGKDGEHGSLSHRIAQRRKEREQRRGSTVVLPVPGYSDLFAARYRRLDAEDIKRITDRPDVADDEQAGSVDMLINGCVDILEVNGTSEDDYISLGKRWTTATVAELFEQEFPPEFPVRAAMRQVLDFKEISKHFVAYAQWMESLESEDAEAVPGESKPSVEG